MSELVERYIHQVGRHLPPKERAEIEAELRSQIEDKLDDRFEGTPTPAQVAAVLAAWGHPQQTAALYREEQYLVGPDLYPVMLMTLRYGWLTVPVSVLFINILAELTSSQPPVFPAALAEPLLAAAYATFLFSALVVLIFALIQRSGSARRQLSKPFNPLTLPEVDDPRAVDRFEAAFGITFGAIMTLILLYWLRVGGLTLRFNPTSPDDIIAVPAFWMVFLVGIIISILCTYLIAVRRNRWSVELFLVETVIEIVGVFGMYFVLYRPIFERIFAGNPALAEVPLLASAPEIIAVLNAILQLLANSGKLIRLWNHRASYAAPTFTPADSG